MSTNSAIPQGTFRVLIAAKGGFYLDVPVLQALHERHPEYFLALGTTPEDLPNTFFQEGILWALNGFDLRLRTNFWLLTQFDQLGSDALTGQKDSVIKAVEIPTDVHWHLHLEEDSLKEEVRENFRSWA